MGYKYFYDLPVYRLTEQQYYHEREKYIEEAIFPRNTPNLEQLRQLEKDKPSIINALRLRHEISYGGAWKFNEIIGYIRLHFLGTQVRGAYFDPNKKRIVRTRCRTLDLQTLKLAPEIDIEHPISNTTILAAVTQYIQDCRRELPRRFIDTELFDSLSLHINWLALFNSK